MINESNRSKNTWVEDYKNKPVVTKNIKIYAHDGVEMREVVKPTLTYYTVNWDDGTVISKCDTAKEATAMFLDFAGITKRKLEECRVA